MGSAFLWLFVGNMLVKTVDIRHVIRLYGQIPFLDKAMMDMVLCVDLLGWLSVTAKDFMSSLGFVKAGVTELFGILYVLYELTSVLKNMMLCGLPVPAGIRQKIGSWLEIMTDETKASLTPKHGKLSIPVHMDPGDLEDFSDEDLLDLAEQMGYELQDPFTRE